MNFKETRKQTFSEESSDGLHESNQIIVPNVFAIGTYELAGGGLKSFAVKGFMKQTDTGPFKVRKTLKFFELRRENYRKIPHSPSENFQIIFPTTRPYQLANFSGATATLL